ncbi:MAG: hypothetical protein QXH92_04395 [Candidatus Aenigmatarchaeota archaeon]
MIKVRSIYGKLSSPELVTTYTAKNKAVTNNEEFQSSSTKSENVNTNFKFTTPSNPTILQPSSYQIPKGTESAPFVPVTNNPNSGSLLAESMSQNINVNLHAPSEKILNFQSEPIKNDNLVVPKLTESKDLLQFDKTNDNPIIVNYYQTNTNTSQSSQIPPISNNLIFQTQDDNQTQFLPNKPLTNTKPDHNPSQSNIPNTSDTNFEINSSNFEPLLTRQESAHLGNLTSLPNYLPVSDQLSNNQINTNINIKPFNENTPTISPTYIEYTNFSNLNNSNEFASSFPADFVANDLTNVQNEPNVIPTISDSMNQIIQTSVTIPNKDLNKSNYSDNSIIPKLPVTNPSIIATTQNINFNNSQNMLQPTSEIVNFIKSDAINSNTTNNLANNIPNLTIEPVGNQEIKLSNYTPTISENPVQPALPQILPLYGSINVKSETAEKPTINFSNIGQITEKSETKTEFNNLNTDLFKAETNAVHAPPIPPVETANNNRNNFDFNNLTNTIETSLASVLMKLGDTIGEAISRGLSNLSVRGKIEGGSSKGDDNIILQFVKGGGFFA